MMSVFADSLHVVVCGVKRLGIITVEKYASIHRFDVAQWEAFDFTEHMKCVVAGQNEMLITRCLALAADRCACCLGRRW